MNKTLFLFILVLMLAFLLRFFYLGRIPNGLYSDEAAYGYNAYSILNTGRDEYGEFIPLAFKSFGEYKTPLYIYFMVPFIKAFGLSVFSVRITSAVLGIGSVILAYLISKIFFGNKMIALLSSFLMAVSPLALQFNRMGHESNLSTFLILAGILFWLLFLKFPNYIFISILSFALSLYAHNDARVITPLILVFLTIFYRRNLAGIKRRFMVGIFLFLFILAPLIFLIPKEGIFNRVSSVSIFSDRGLIEDINVERGDDMKKAFVLPSLFHNKTLSYTKKIIDNYMDHFSSDFLFLSGDPVKIYQTVGNGIILLTLAPFLPLGLYFIFRRKFTQRWLILFWFMVSPVPAALTKFVPSASRSFLMSGISSLILAAGMYYSLKKWQKYLLVFLFVMNFAYYLHFYYVNTPVRYAKEWHYGMDEVISKVNTIESRYNKVWFSRNAWGYIYPLFFLKYPPEKYQTQAKLSSLNEFGFGWVYGFDKYVFDDFPSDLNTKKNTLFIGAPSDFAGNIVPVATIYYPDGNPAFFIVDYEN